MNTTNGPQPGQQGFRQKERSPHDIVNEYVDYVDSIIALRKGYNIVQVHRLRALGAELKRVAAEHFLDLYADLDDGK